MVYSSPEYFLFLFICTAIYALMPTQSARMAFLTGASFFFYSWAGSFDFIVFISVLIISWSTTWFSLRLPRFKKYFIAVGIAVLGAHLAIWKYAPWAVNGMQQIIPTFFNGQRLRLPLPIGISFFTLQGIAYLIDFNQDAAEFMTFRKFALFKSFFPQLIAGPIVRARQLIPQIEALRRPRARDIVAGSALFTLGFFKKVLLADRTGNFVDNVFAHPSFFPRSSLLIGTLGYAVQIWADFSGYTDMGRGSAKMLGVTLPENFLSPYLAREQGLTVPGPFPASRLNFA